MFEHPLLLVTLAIPGLLAYRSWYRRRAASVTFPSLQFLGTHRPTLRERLRLVPDVLRLATLVLLALALAGPAVVRTDDRSAGGGLDVMFLIDASRSMLARDLVPDRLEAARRIAEGLVAARPSDRFGIMTFAERATIQCPLTTDHDAVTARLRQLAIRDREEGTALGVAIAAALHQIRATSRGVSLLVLLTDGAGNLGQITADDAADVAAAMDIRIYALGLGGDGLAPYPSELGLVEVNLELDDRTLGRVASTTGGIYVAATEPARALERLTAELNLLAGSSGAALQDSGRADAAGVWLTAALACLLLDLLLRATWLRTFP